MCVDGSLVGNHPSMPLINRPIKEQMFFLDVTWKYLVPALTKAL